MARRDKKIADTRAEQNNPVCAGISAVILSCNELRATWSRRGMKCFKRPQRKATKVNPVSQATQKKKRRGKQVVTETQQK